MSTISFILRKPNKQGECPVSVKHVHGTYSPFVKSTGVSVPAKYFNTTTGKVSPKLPGYVEYNTTIEQVRADVEKAARNVLGWEEIPDRETVAREFAAILKARANTISNLHIIKNKFTDNLLQLKAELAELEIQVEIKKTAIRDYEMNLNLFEGKLLSTFIKDYKNTQKISTNTKRAYDNLLKLTKEFNQFWEITDVTPLTLIDFENYLVSTGLNNSSINIYVKRVKTVVVKYADKLQLNKQVIKDHRVESKALRKQEILFLSETELSDFKAVQVPSRREIVKDSFILMASTGLRFSDSFITPDKIKGNFIVLHTQKTDTLVRIPINNTAREILEKYNYTMPKQYLPNFTRVLKIIAKQAGITELVHTSKRVGAVKTEDYVEKWHLMSAHVARKSFISHALSSGVNPAVLKQWIGHSKMELMFTTYANGSMNTVAEMNKIVTV